MKTLIALSMLLISSVSFAEYYDGTAIVTVNQDIVAQTPDNREAYVVGITMGKPNCAASYSASRPFTLKKGTRLKVAYEAAEKEVWADGDGVTSIPTFGNTYISMKYEMEDGYYLAVNATCMNSGTLFPRRGLPTLNELLEKASSLFTIELQ